MALSIGKSGHTPLVVPPSPPQATGSDGGKQRRSNKEHGTSSAQDGDIPRTPLSVSSLAVVCSNSLETANVKPVSLTTRFRAVERRESVAAAGLRISQLQVSSSRFGAAELPAHLVAIDTSRFELNVTHHCAPCPHCNPHLYVSRTEAYLFPYLFPRNHVSGNKTGKARAL